MGELLVRKALLTAADLMRATGIVHRDGKRLGRVLVEMGLLDGEGLREVVAFHADFVLSRAFAWTEGQYEFREELGRALDAEELTLPYSTGDLILRASRSVQDPDVVRYRLGDLDRLVALVTRPAPALPAPEPHRRRRLRAGPAWTGTRARARSSRRRGLVPEEVRTSLFALLNTGAIEYVGASRGRAAAASGSRPRPATSSMRAAAGPRPPAVSRRSSSAASRPRERRNGSARPARRPPGRARAGDAAARAGRRSPRRLEARRAEILEAYASLATRTHFELLGLHAGGRRRPVARGVLSGGEALSPGRATTSPASPTCARSWRPSSSTWARSTRRSAARGCGPGTRESWRALPPPGKAGRPRGSRSCPEDTIARAAECVVRERYWGRRCRSWKEPSPGRAAG